MHRCICAQTSLLPLTLENILSLDADEISELINFITLLIIAAGT